MSKNKEQKITEDILDRICIHISSKKLNLSKITQDGRINSAANELEISKELKIFEASDEEMKKLGLKISLPNTTNNREWYDFAIESEDDSKKFFSPVNIKVTDLNTNAADNLNCKMGLFYAVAGIRPDIVAKKEESPFGNGTDWSKFFTVLKKYMATDKNKDYYFLVVNKSDTSDVFWNSLRQLDCLVPNGNNPPFQCVWSKNRNRVERTYIQSRKFILSALNETMNKRAQPTVDYNKLIKPFINLETDLLPEETEE